VYTKLSHLKKGSVKVEEGEKVSYGQVIAQCGNSGRSPYPHLHFQVQEFPYIGSATKDYPISSFVLHQENRYSFHTHEKPHENEQVSNIEVNDLLVQAFSFTPGEVLRFNVEGFKNIDKVKWEVKVNHLNETYIECDRSGAIAYFDRDENQFHFTYFEGSKDCLLFYFFLAAYKIQEGFYQDLELEDHYPLSLNFPKPILWFHDFISPFTRIASSEYRMKYTHIDDYISPSEITLESEMSNRLGKKKLNEKQFATNINRKGIAHFSIHFNDHNIDMHRCEE
jgi:hypothetical protein